MTELTQTQREAWDRSARDYATFASRSNLYLETAAALVRRAKVRRGMTVVDLACGTGMVTEAILGQRNGKSVRIIGIDYAPEMIAVARERIDAPTVTFHCESAERLSHVAGMAQADRVLCNAAFWQFDRESALAEIVKVLKPEGKCLLTLPNWADIIDEPDVMYEKHKLGWMILEELFLRGYRLRRQAPRVPAIAPATSTGAELFRFSTAGLRVEVIEEIAIQATAEDYFEFLRIPVMLRRFSASSGAPEDELRDIMTVVRHEIEWVDPRVPPQKWRIIVLQKTTQ